MQDVSLAIVFAATILALYVRPFGAHDWQVAGIGAMAAWLAGPMGFEDGLETVADSAGILAFFLGLMLISAGAEACGLYERATALIRRPTTIRGQAGVVLVAGAAITAVLSNDATPLVLTPAIYGAVRSAGAAKHPALAATFAADGASLLLPVSNPVNLLFFERFEMGFGAYLTTITPAAFAGVAALAVVLWRRCPAVAVQATPRTVAVQPRSRTVAALAVVVALAAAYVAAGTLELPLSAVTLAGGASLVAVAVGTGPLDRAAARKHVSPGALVFVAALLLLVESIREAGLLGPLAGALEDLQQRPQMVTVFGTAILAAALANVMNNWPSALVFAAAIELLTGDREAVIAGALIGSAIGANFTMIGSLSTVFWLSLARRAGGDFGHGEYARAAFVPTLAALTAACLVAAVLV